jgi:hypothetical protein
MCVVVGDHVTLGDQAIPFSARWDGQRWTALPVPRLAKVTELNSVSCPGADSCYAAGDLGPTLAVPVHPLTLHWDGSRWHRVAVPGAPREAIFSAVSCPTLTDCTVVGKVGGDESFSRMLVEDLSQGRWTKSLPAVPAAAAAGTTAFTAVSCSEPQVCTALVSYLHPAPAGVTPGPPPPGTPAAGSGSRSRPGTSADQLGGCPASAWRARWWVSRARSPPVVARLSPSAARTATSPGSAPRTPGRLGLTQRTV